MFMARPIASLFKIRMSSPHERNYMVKGGVTAKRRCNGRQETLTIINEYYKHSSRYECKHVLLNQTERTTISLTTYDYQNVNAGNLQRPNTLKLLVQNRQIRRRHK